MNINSYQIPNKISKLNDLEIGDIGYYQNGILIAFEADDSYANIKNDHGAVCVMFTLDKEGVLSYYFESQFQLSDWVYFPENPIVLLIDKNDRQISIHTNPKATKHSVYLDHDGRLLLPFDHGCFDIKSKSIHSKRTDTAYLMRVNSWMFAEQNAEKFIPIFDVSSKK